MLYASPGAVLAAIARTLREQVLPAVAERDARGQLWAAIGLLDNLAVSADEGSAALADELLELRELLAAAPPELGAADAGNVDARRGGSGAGRDGTADAGAGERAVAVAPDRGLEPQLAAAHARLGQALAAAAALGERSEAVAAWLERCRLVLGERNRAQVAEMRPTRYASAVRGD